MPSFGHLRNPPAHDPLGDPAGEVAARERDVAPRGAHEAAHRVDKGRLPGTVRPHHRDHLPVVELEGDAAKGAHGPVVDRETADAEQRILVAVRPGPGAVRRGRTPVPAASVSAVPSASSDA